MKKNDLLLVVDMQNVYKKGGKWQCENTEGAADNINKIIASGMNNVIFTKFIANEKNPVGVWKDYNVKYQDVNHDEYANEIVDELKENAEKFPVYEKSVYSSIENKKVIKACKKAGRVVVTGVVSECCVLSTILALMDKGIYAVYLKDACSGLDKPKEAATELIFSGLSPLHVLMMTTDEYLAEK